MATCLKESYSSTEKEKSDLLAELVIKIENILAVKIDDIWHISGALDGVISSIFAILSHGCIEDKGAKSSLWNFIFGLRVIRPDLWPQGDLKIGDKILGNSQPISQWLEVSLRSFCLCEQMWALISDSKRLCIYYEGWAFLRCSIFSEALMIALQAIEKKSSEFLSTLKPSLVNSVNASNSYKEEILKNRSNSNCANGIRFYISDEETEKESIDSGDLTDYINALSISPSAIQVSYSDIKTPESSFSNRETDGGNIKSSIDINNDLSSSCSSSSKILSFHEQSKDVTYEAINSNKGSPLSSDFDLSSNTFVQPSPFLLQYLNSKGKCQSVNDGSSSNIKELIFQPDANFMLNYSSDIVEYSDNSIVEAGSSADRRISDIDLKYTSSVLPELNNLENVNGIHIVDNARHVELPSKKKAFHQRSRSDEVRKIDFSSKHSTTSVSPVYPTTVEVAENSGRKGFMEDGGHSITPEADGFFPQPQPGQGLREFLASSEFTKTCAQLDRENAHFNIAEAVLAALEQVNFKKSSKECRRRKERIIDESEDDILNHRSQSSVRRKPRIRSRTQCSNITSDDEFPVTTDNSVFDSSDSLSSQDSNTNDTVFEDGKKEVKAENIESSSASCSAENVGLSILQHYNSKLLPKASDLQWLVSEKDAPQKLLPIPTSIPVDPDEAQAISNTQSSSTTTLLRGTNDWAPPRPQLILTLHRNLKRKNILSYQNWRCAGCGLLVSEKLSVHFKLCHYYGRYFCTNCFTNKKAVIPARVLHLWDFKKYAVCNFSFELLGRMINDPLFHVGSLNPRLYSMSRDLQQTHIYRFQLYHSKNYIITCKRAESVKKKLDSVPNTWYSDPQMYSMNDFLSVKQGNMLQEVKKLTSMCIKHISGCEVCLGRGFICEICRLGEPIFAFQLDAVNVCKKCGSCFHWVCFSRIPSGHGCPRCLRRKISS